MKRIKKAVAVVGKYTNSNGEEKNQYATLGALFKRDDGSVCLKLDTVPVGEFNGWVNFYDFEERQQQAAPPPQDNFEDSDLPF